MLQVRCQIMSRHPFAFQQLLIAVLSTWLTIFVAIFVKSFRICEETPSFQSKG